MAFFDLDGAALREHRCDSPEPAGFDAFWAATLALTRAHPLAATFDPVACGLRLVDVFDVTFAGWDGEPVRGWLTLPTSTSTSPSITSTSTEAGLPAVVEYVGYGGGRGYPQGPSVYALAGFAHLVMDTRGQGSTWSPGATGDPDPTGAPQIPGFVTRGVLDPERYYYRRVFADAVRAVETVRAHPAVDASRVAVTGGSQGGGIAIAAAGLVGDLVGAAPDAPFLSDIRRATTLVDTDPYGEIARYARTHRDRIEPMFATLGFVDVVHHAARASAPALFSVALMDDICPPSTVYASYNAWAGPKRIIEYPYNGHEAGGGHHQQVKLAFLHEIFGTDRSIR